MDYDSSEIFGINLRLINSYIGERYGLLIDLIKVVTEIANDKIKEYRGVPIVLTNNDILTDIEILKRENEKRFSVYEGYTFLIEYIRNAFESRKKCHEISFDEKVLDLYLERLKELIPKIKANLEKVVYEKIFIGINARGYEFEKISIYLYYEKNEVGKEYFEGLIKHSDLPKEFLNINDFYLYRFVYDAYLFNKMKDTSYVIYKDLLHNPEVYISNGVVVFTGYGL